MPQVELGPAARRLVAGGAVLGAVSAVGVVVYRVAGWSWLDALYMVTITVCAVGYGEVQPMAPGLRWFTIALIVTGCSSLIYILGAFFQMVTEGQLNRVLGSRRMEREL